jgi:putative DNA primase/helicase
MAAGADLDRVYFLRAIKQDDKERWFLLGEDLDALERMIRDLDACLVTIDPITAFMGKINSHNTTDVRGQLGPLADLAERTNVALSTVTHPPKQAGPQAINHFVGSQAFITAARIGHLSIAEHKTDAAGQQVPTGRYLFTMAATNHKKMPALAYEIVETVVRQPVPKGDRTAALRARATATEAVYVDWLEVLQMSADEAVAATTTKKTTRTREIDDFLREQLRSGPQPQTDILARAMKKGYSADQLDRAKRRIHVQSDKVNGRWVWKLRG